jgi:signal transduction histidine kinase
MWSKLIYEMVVYEPLPGKPNPTRDDAPRVLVVDDEEPVMLGIQGILQLDGYEVIGAVTAASAIELLRSQHFDVVLTDMQLDDGMDGIELVREARSQSADAVSIMLTGYASLDSAVNALREGAYDYLVKPCDILELRTTVNRGVEHSRLAAQIRERVQELEKANETIRAMNVELEERVSRATAELRDQITARDDFMASVSHDLKTPLTFIKGLSTLRRRRAVPTPETQPLLDALDQIEASATRMAQQLDQLVDASRLQAGKPVELRRDKTDLVALARKAVAQHQATSDRHVVQLAGTRPEVSGTWDEVRLGRVLDNLLDNAIKYSPRGGAVEVTVDADGTEAVLTVSDRGEGIPSSDLPHIFERFMRGRNVEGRIPGTGIGLAGVHRIVQLHGGSISVESEVGRGTTFTIRLPLSASV